MLSWKLSVVEIPLVKELTANCLVETRTNLEELVPAAMVKYGLNREQLPCGWRSPWLMVSHGMVCLGPRWSANICKVCWGRVELQSRGHSALKITCVFFFFFFFFFFFSYRYFKATLILTLWWLLFSLLLSLHVLFVFDVWQAHIQTTGEWDLKY